MATAKKKTKNLVNLDIVKEKNVDAALANFDIEFADDTALVDKAATLFEHYESNFEEDDLLVCDKCGGLSIESDSACPFCGDNGEIIVEPTSKVAKKKTAKKAAAKKTKGKRSGAKKKTSKKALVAEVVNPVLDKYSVEHLDEIVVSIRSKLKLIGSSAYDLGLDIKRVHDDQLYKLRATKEGKPRYATFKQFANQELGISATWAYTAMDMVAYFSREQVEQLGVKKLQVALRAPEAKRHEVIEAVQAGATVREVRDKIAEYQRESRGESAEPPPKKGKGKVAVPIKMGRRTIPLFKRPLKNSAERVPATKVSEEPFAEVMLDEKTRVMMSVRVQEDKKGELRAVIEFRRDSQ